MIVKFHLCTSGMPYDSISREDSMGHKLLRILAWSLPSKELLRSSSSGKGVMMALSKGWVIRDEEAGKLDCSSCDLIFSSFLSLKTFAEGKFILFLSTGLIETVLDWPDCVPGCALGLDPFNLVMCWFGSWFPDFWDGIGWSTLALFLSTFLRPFFSPAKTLVVGWIKRLLSTGLIEITSGLSTSFSGFILLVKWMGLGSWYWFFRCAYSDLCSGLNMPETPGKDELDSGSGLNSFCFISLSVWGPRTGLSNRFRSWPSSSWILVCSCSPPSGKRAELDCFKCFSLAICCCKSLALLCGLHVTHIFALCQVQQLPKLICMPLFQAFQKTKPHIQYKIGMGVKLGRDEQSLHLKIIVWDSQLTTYLRWGPNTDGILCLL